MKKAALKKSGRPMWEKVNDCQQKIISLEFS